MPIFIAVAIVLTCVAVALVVVPLLRQRGGEAAPIAATISALLIPATVLLLYVTVSNHGWQEATADASSATAPDLGQAVARLEARLAAQPDDVDGWLLLGNSYVQLQRYGEAASAFGRALELSGGSNTVAKLGVAEAQALQDRNALAGEAGRLIEEVLAAEPDNPKALWYGGLVALTRNDTAALEARWRRLLSQSPPEQIRRIIEQQLSVEGTQDVAGGSPVTGTSIEVQVSVGGDLAKQVQPGAALFLVARDADQAGPPVAVIRRSADQLPTTLRISDDDVMVPGRSLADLSRIRLIARVANGGEPLAQPGDVFGETVLSGEQTGGASVAILMDQLVKP